MTLSTKEVEYFPELDLSYLKEIVKNRAAKKFKGLPLERITLYRYAGQYSPELRPATQYVIVFDLAASWQELTREQLEQCRDLDIETGWMASIFDEDTLCSWGLDGAFKHVYNRSV